MALNANNVPRTGGGKRAPILDEGAYPARLVWLIDLGLQTQRAYKGEPKPPAYALQTVYESSDEFMPDEEGNPDETKPRFFWEDFKLYPLNTDLAISTKRYYALDPNSEHDGDWSKLIGAPVIVALTRSKGNDGNEYNNVGTTSTMRAKEAAKLPDLVNEPKLFDLDNPDIDVFLSLPGRLQETIKGNLNYEGSLLQKRLKSHKNDEKGEEKEERPTKKELVPDVKSGVEETASHSDARDTQDEGDDGEW